MSKRVRKLYQCSCILLCMVLFLALLPTAALAQEPEEAPIRAGWYEDAYNITGPNGERSGYGYEYEQAVAAYTGWTYEYVKDGWADLLERMENGEIDIMPGISYTEERAQKMLFSELPMGTEKYYLYADLAHTDISASDLSTLNGKRIALMPTSVQATQFYAWEKSHGLQMQYVPANSFEEGKQMAENGEIDCVISTETPDWVELGFSAIATTGGSDIYFAINKNRPDLKEELDNAMRKMESDKPFYADELYQRYLSSVSQPMLSGEEQDWLAQHGRIRIGCLKQDGGISDFDPEHNTVTGVITDYVRFASDCLNNAALEFELTPFDTMEEEVQALQEGQIDLIFHFTQNPYIAEENGFVLSNTVLSLNMAAITPENYFNETSAVTVAVEKENLLYQWYISYHYPTWNILLCDSAQDLEKAVTGGQADCLLVESGEVVKYSENKRLHSVFLEQPGNTSFAVKRGNAMLMSILNKTLRTIPTSMLTGALPMYEGSLQKVTVADFIKDNLAAVTAVCFTVVAIVMILILGFLRRSVQAETKAKQAAAQAQELNRQLQFSQKELQAALQQAESANAAKTTFLSNVSHDIRTPMNAIVGITTLMEHEPGLSDKMQEYLSKLQASSSHLLNLINEILDMNKIEAGKATLYVEPFSLQDQIRQIDSVVRPQARARNQSFAICTHNIQHDRLEGDATRLRQVMLNLLSNAVKYTGQGGHITFDVEELPRSGHYARYKFRITDDGIGMSEEFQKHIYDPFVRAENSVTNKVQGTGLGMSITKGIVDMMGGAISLESQLGKGSRFEVMLEFKTDPNAENGTVPAEPEKYEDTVADAPEGSVLKGMRFLCAEDNAINAEILQAVLEMQGASCTICRDGKEIVEKFRTVRPGEYDAILMDVQMPGMNGYEATRAIRSGENPLGRTIPIFAMTANAFSEDVQKSYDVGMDAHLSKPVELKELERTLHRFHCTHQT